MIPNNTAYLYNNNDYIVFAFGDKEIRFKGPYSLKKIDKVTLWDKGYIVVDAYYEHSNNVIEDYIDMVPILEDLYIDADSFLEPIKKVEVLNV